MAKYLEITIKIPLPDSWADQVNIAGKIAPIQNKFKADLEKLNVGACVSDRTYTPKPRGGAVATNFAVEPIASDPPAFDPA